METRSVFVERDIPPVINPEGPAEEKGEKEEQSAAPSADLEVIPHCPIDQLAILPELQVRTVIDPGVVAEYTKIVGSGQRMDPWDAFQDPETGRTILADGFHRRLAYLATNKEYAPVRVRLGGLSEALEFAMRINCSHGARMTNADKRRAVKLAVDDPRIGQFADRKIAAMCRVSEALVGEVRRGETAVVARVKREKRKKHKTAKPPEKKAATGNRETPVTVREREPVPDVNEKLADRIKTLQSWISAGDMGEDDIVTLFSTESLQYRLFAKDGRKITMRIKGKAGRYRSIEAVLDFMDEARIDMTAVKGYTLEVEG